MGTDDLLLRRGLWINLLIYLVFRRFLGAKYVDLGGNFSRAHNFSLQLIHYLFPWLLSLIESRHVSLLVVVNRISVVSRIIILGQVLRLIQF